MKVKPILHDKNYFLFISLLLVNCLLEFWVFSLKNTCCLIDGHAWSEELQILSKRRSTPQVQKNDQSRSTRYIAKSSDKKNPQETFACSHFASLNNGRGILAL